MEYWKLLALIVSISISPGSAIPETDCPDILCTADYRPVCGSDGRTYSNGCNLDLASCGHPDLSKVCDGECPCGSETKRKNCMARFSCPLHYRPVCGSDGKTYSNPCVIQSHRLCNDKGLKIDCARSCPCDCTWGCTANYDPACGTNGVTYSNVCEAARAHCLDPSIGVDCMGACPCSQDQK